LLLNVWEKIPGAPTIQVDDGPASEARRGDTVLYSLLTMQLPELSREIQLLRERGVILVAGGPHASADPEFIRRVGFHTAVTGDGETALPYLIRDLAAHKSLRPEYAGGRQHDFSSWLPLSSRITTLPPLELMRGCYYRCEYCATPGTGRPRFRPLDSVRDYLERLRNRGASRVNFLCPSALDYRDPVLGASPKESVARLLHSARHAGFRHIEYGIFPSEIRPGTLDDEWVRLLRSYVSHHRLTLGAQSGFPGRLQTLRRGHTIEDVEAAIHVANTGGFTVNVDIIVGYPDESPDERQATFDFVCRLHREHQVHIQVHHFFPLPGTPLQHRFPTFFKLQGERALARLHQDGLITLQWKKDRDASRRYFEWLRCFHPEEYALFH